MAKAKPQRAFLAGQTIPYWLERIMDKDRDTATQAREALASTG